MRKLIASLSAVVLLGVAAPAVESASRSVQLRDNYFSPKSTSVSRNTTVTWRWAGRSSHNVVVKSGPVKFSSRLQRSGNYRRRLSRRGTYSIVCSIHPGMALKLKVR